MNKVILIGNLGADPELKYTQGGQAVMQLRLCTTEKWKDKQGQRQEKAAWHTCVYWGKGAEAVQKYLQKGKQIMVEGSIDYRTWEKGDGTKGYATEIRVDRLEMLGGGGGQRRDGYVKPAVDPNTGEVFGGGHMEPGEGDDNLMF
jgi:single-strand DNA-binding protein